MAMIKEDERYSLTLNATDRDGSPALAYVVIVNENMIPEAVAVTGTRELRLKKGTYSAMALMDVDVNTDHRGVALVGDPEVILDGPKTVELDARKANEITTKLPKKVEPNYKRIETYRTLGNRNAHDIYLLPVWTDKMYAVPAKEVTTGKFELVTRWRMTKPMLTINFKGTELGDIPMAGSTLLDGKYNLKAVYAGKGSPADYEGLNAEGKAVIVERSTEIKGSGQAAAALDAGAKLLIISNYDNTKFNEYVGTPEYTDTPLAVAAISKQEGEKLIQAARSGNVQLQVEGTVNTPYVYDLVSAHKGSVPENVAYEPKNDELVKIDTNYNSPVETAGGEFRYDLRPHTRGAVGFLFKLSLPSQRTEWVSATEDTSWYHQANVLDATWQIRQPLQSYTKGEKLTENWFSPVVRPALGSGYWTPERQGDSLMINVPAWADAGKGNTGGTEYNISVQNQTTKLFKGETLIREGKGQAVNGFGVLTDQLQEFRVVTEAKRDAERWNTSVGTHTEWTFKAKEEPEAWRSPLPFLTLNYNIETDVNGNAPLNRPTNLELSVDKVANAIGYGNVDGAALEISFDEGETWTDVKLTRSGDKFTAGIKNPKSATSVSLKATAWDDNGNKISQEIIKAYGLK
jgi:hypothetical protein